MSEQSAVVRHSAAIERGDAFVQNGVVVFRDVAHAVAEEKTLADVYREYVALRGGPVVAPPADADATERAAYENADLQRWYELTQARRNSDAPAEYIEKLEAARTPADVSAALHWLRNRSAPLDGARVERVKVDKKAEKKALKEFEKQAALRAERAEKLGMQVAHTDSVQLVDDDGKTYTVSLVNEVKGVDAQRLRRQHNVFEKRTMYEVNEEDPVFRELRSAATAAAMFVKAGNCVPPKYRDSELARYFEDLTPTMAAERIRAFELYQNMRTRPDKQPHRHVALSEDFFRDTCARRGHKDRLRLDRIGFLDPVTITEEMQRMRNSISVIMQTAPVLDALFVPSLMYSVLTHPEPAPRVVPYSQVFGLYFVIARIFSASDLLPDEKQAKKMAKAERRRLQRAGVEPHPVDPRYARANELVSKKTARDYLIGGREACVSDFAATLRWICVQYEKRQAPVTTAADYYRNVYGAVRKYMCDVLNTYERAFCLYLDKYVARSDSGSLLTLFHLPSQGIVADDIHTKLLCANETLTNCSSRATAYERVRDEDTFVVFEASDGVTSRLPYPELDDSCAGHDVIYKSYESTPTFDQMRKLVRFLVHESATAPADVAEQARQARGESRLAKQSAGQEDDDKKADAKEYRAADDETIVARPVASARASGVGVKEKE